MHAPAAVEVRGLHVTRGGVPVLSGIDLTVMRGRLLGVLGPNGGGKSTLLRVLVGLQHLDSGVVRVLGKPPGRSREVGYLPQTPTYDSRFPATVRDVVALGLPPQSRKARRHVTERILEQMELTPLADRSVGVLSGGERQRLFLARALVREPRLLLLDEPTLGVDARSLDTFLHLLVRIREERELTVVMVSHDFSVMTTHADEIVCLAGKVHCMRSPADLDEETLTEVFGKHTLFLEHRH